MSAFMPFAVVTASVSGRTVVITPGPIGTSATGSLDSTNGYTPTLMIVNGGTTMAWVRISQETTPAATVNDIPLPASSVRLFANPAATGRLGIAVVATVTTTLANVYFVPGEGGI